MIEKQKEIFKDRYDYYKERIESVIYPKEESEKLTPNNYQENLTKEESTKQIRTQLLKQKYDHTLRVVNTIDKMSTDLITNQDIKTLALLSGLLHDYGRFIQAVYHNSYQEAELFYKDYGYNGHGEVGAKLLFEFNEIAPFNINKSYYDILYDVIKYHQVPNLPQNLNIMIKDENNLQDKDTLKSFLLQIVKDADMYDILYQRINGEYPIFSDTFKMHVNNMSIYDISAQTGIDINTIKKWNNLSNNDISHLKKIKLPFSQIDPKLLEVPDKIKEQFFNQIYFSNNNEWDFNKMLKDNTFNYNSITAMWWTIGQFLSKMNFTATLKTIKQEQILEQIYNKYPDKYKYLVKEMFEFAISNLLDERIKEESIYTKRKI